MMIRCFYLPLLFATAVCTQQKETEFVVFNGSTMGTNYVVRIAESLSESDQSEVSRAVEDVLERVDASMSTYRLDSELSYLNRSSSASPIEISASMFYVVQEALHISRLTSGAFDITVTPLVRLWGFGAGAAKVPAVPTDGSLAIASKLVGFQHVTLTENPLSLKKNIEGLEIDLSGIAKGFGVDQVSELLTKKGLRNYMVEIGGEVRTMGKNSDGNAWQIGVEMPTGNSYRLQHIVPLSGLAMATSGDYRNFYEEEGVRYSHIIDPRSGSPISQLLASVTVVEQTCIRADGLASGLLVLGPEEGFELAMQEDLTAMFLVRSPEGELVERLTPSYKQLLSVVGKMEQ